MPNVRVRFSPNSGFFSAPSSLLAAFVIALLAGLSASAQNVVNTIEWAEPTAKAMANEGFVRVMAVRSPYAGGRVQADVIVTTQDPGTNATTFPGGTIVFSEWQMAANLNIPVRAHTNSPSASFKIALTNAVVVAGEDTNFAPVIGANKEMTITVVKNDDPFTFYFSSLNPTVSEGGQLRLQVRIAGQPDQINGQNLSVDWEVQTASDLHPGSEEASIDPSDLGTNELSGTLTFEGSTNSQTIVIDIPQDDQIEFNEDFKIVLSNPQGMAGTPDPTNAFGILPEAAESTVTILFNSSPNQSQPPGAVDTSFNANTRVASPGANQQVLASELDINGVSSFIGGQFSAYNAAPRPFIARILADGSLDQSFRPPSGPDGPVTAIAVYKEGPNRGKILIGGAFVAVDAQPRAGIARLNQDGTLDTSFNPGLGANGIVFAIKIEPGGAAAIIGGDFTSYNGVLRGGLARIRADGSLDTGYFAGLGANGPVFDIAQQDSASQLISAEDRSNGTTNIISRDIPINANGGTFTFTIGSDTAGSVEPLGENVNDQFVLLLNGQVIYDSGFINTVTLTTNDANGQVTETNILRTVTLSVSGNAATNVLTVTVTPGTTNEIPSGWQWNLSVSLFGPRDVVAVGDFDKVNGIAAPRVARITTGGAFDQAFNAGMGTGPNGPVSAVAVHSSGSVVVGGTFSAINSVVMPGLGRLSPVGEPDPFFFPGVGANNRVADVEIDSSDHIYIAGDFTAYNTTRRIFLARLQVDGTLDTTFLDTAYNHFAGFPNPNGGLPFGGLSTVRVDANGDVLVGGIFAAVGGGGTSRSGAERRSNYARLRGGSEATIAPGNVQLFADSVGVEEDGIAVPVDFTRGFGLVGPIDVTFHTFDGSAVSGLDYTGVTNLIVTFPHRQSAVSGTPLLNIIDEVPKLIEGNESFDIEIASIASLLRLTGEPIPVGAALGPIRSTRVEIIDNDFPEAVFSLSKVEYEVDEAGSFATIELVRTGFLDNAASIIARAVVSGATNAATPVSDFTLTSSNFNFIINQTKATFRVPVRDDANVESDETILIQIASPSPGAAIGVISNAVLTIIDNDLPSGKIDFAATNFVVVEGQTNVAITLRRTGGNVGIISLDVRTVAGTAAVGSDFISVASRVTWNHGDISNRTVLIPIVDDLTVEGSERFTVVLKNGLPTTGIGTRVPQANVTIDDNDFFGTLSLSAAEYFTDENGASALVQVVRRDGNAGTVSVNYTTVTNSVATNTARPGIDYVSTNGTLVFGPGETAKTIVIPILDDNTNDNTRIFLVRLSGITNATAGTFQFASVSILDNEALNIPAGRVEPDFATGEGANGDINFVAVQSEAGGSATRKIIVAGEFTQYANQVRERVARLNDDGTLDSRYASGLTIDGLVHAAALTSDGKLLLGGSFTNVGGFPSRYVARLSVNGERDTLFATGSGADNPVYAVAETFATEGGVRVPRFVIGGDFTTINSTMRQRVAVLRNDGSIDPTFNPGLGPNATVTAIAAQRDGKIVIGGEFTTVAGTPRRFLARLSADGTLDTSFNAGAGFDGPVRSLAVQVDDSILVGGDFLNVNNQPSPRLARLRADGEVDAGFNVGGGANGPITAIALQADGSIIVVGSFTQFNGVSRNGVTRLRADGSLDFNINFGSGANGTVKAVAVQSDRKIIIAGGFTTVDGAPRNRIARLFGGSVLGAGQIEFDSALYQVNETVGTASIQLRRIGGTTGTISTEFQTFTLDATPFADYLDTNGLITFGPGEVLRNITVQILNDASAESPEHFGIFLTNAVGSPIGRQPFSTVQIVSDDSLLSIASEAYLVNEAAPGGRVNIEIIRQGLATSAVQANLRSLSGPSPGGATAGSDFTNINANVTFLPGEVLKIISVPIIEDLVVEGNEVFTVNLTTTTAGVQIGRGSAEITIQDNDTAPGTIAIVGPVQVNEAAGAVVVTLTRSAGREGAIDVNYATENGIATAGLDYSARSGVVRFESTDTTRTIVIPISDDAEVERNETFLVRLSNLSAGVLGTSVSTVTIVDNDTGPGSIDKTFDPGTAADGTIRAIEMDAGGLLLIGGDFTSFNNDGSRARIARLLPSGSLDAGFSTGNRPNNSVRSLAYDNDGRIIMGGDFNVVNSQQAIRIARLDAYGALDPSFFLPGGLNGEASAVAVYPESAGGLAGSVLVGGAFEFGSAAAIRRIIRLQPHGQVDTSFNPGSGANLTVNAVALQADGKALIGGDFSSVNGVALGHLARLNLNGSVDLTFPVGSGFSRADGGLATVNDILILDADRILVAGSFTRYNGTPRANIAILDASGSLTPFASELTNVNGPIRTIALERNDHTNTGKIFIGGDFTQINGVRRQRVARLDANGRLDLTFDPGDGANATVNGIIVQSSDARVVVVGAFTQFNSDPKYRRIVRLDNDKALEAPVNYGDIIITPSIASGGAVIQITWVNGGTLYSAPSVNGPWTTTNDSDGSFEDTIPNTGSAKFYMVR